MSDKMNFQAEVGKLLDIVVNSLYSERQIFLRELISNASDALDKLKYMALTHPEMSKEAGEPKIKIIPDADKRTLTIEDNGIGMNRDDLINHLGTIAKSGTAEFVKNVKDNGSAVDLIGQFGVGFIRRLWWRTKLRLQPAVPERIKPGFGFPTGSAVLKSAKASATVTARPLSCF